MNTKPPVIELKSPFRSRSSKDNTPSNFPMNLQNPAQFQTSNQKDIRKSPNSSFIPSPEIQTQQQPFQQSFQHQEIVQDRVDKTTKAQPQSDSEYKRIVLSGSVAKRHPYLMFYQTRLLVLSEVSGEPYLRYYNPSNNELRVMF